MTNFNCFIARDLRQKGLYGALFLGFICGFRQDPSFAQSAGGTAMPPAAVMQEEGATIPVATFTGIQRMTQQEYEIYIQLMKNLPVMSKAYVFGHTIPQPQTDQSGYIHLSAASPPNSADIAVPQKDETLVPVATSAGILPMKLQEYEMHVRSMGYLPMSKAHVLGHTILQSKTDKLGHIHPSVAPRVATTDVGQPK